jgi:cell division protein FtsB
MEGDFYRGLQPRNWFRHKARNLFKNRRRAAVVAAGVLLLLYVLFNNKGVVTRIRLEMQRDAAVQQLKEAEAESLRLQQQLKALEGDPKTIEKIARERYGMTREGETVYRIKKN